ncbi:hypothetical protein [Natronorubrum halophilum]|uniref:hypothetical protein n=1 Tax=Natronorubrum halophilum TaxID=1702106 RepID=UPI000EF6C87F|nr:hypothetical protein [Natronorubrum halophilum]
MYLDLANFTDDTRTFHFALEATDGLGEWHDFAVDSGGDGFVHREVVVEPDPDREWTRTHVIAGEKRSSNRILKAKGGRTCLHREYRLEEEQLTALLAAEKCYPRVLASESVIVSGVNET